ncbi:MAG TPA: hypoxanthine phosphoribosyltransferase [Chloroflexi bacterium]|jgi:hypoxanthine phosphoribosyltransferase|nr:hypoxanthine phosphoribosyltransferase [Chloroflexota bacterium]
MEDLQSELAQVLVSEQQIRDQVSEIAGQISSDYEGVDNLYIVGILKGAFIFLADLARELRIPHSVDFMAVSSYGKKGATSGEVRLVMDLREPVTDKHVLIVEDIIDTGQTLTYLLKTLKGRRPASLKTCVLVRKDRKSLDVAIDYLGFVIPDVWVVGYGLDYLDRYRTLPFIAELDRRVYDVPA